MRRIGAKTSEPVPVVEKSSSRFRTVIHVLGRHPKFLFPSVLLVIFLFLSAAGISGTSIASLKQTPSSDLNVVWGTPKRIRGDEYLVRTPFLMGQVERGFPAVADLGVGSHDMGVLYYLPTKDWSLIFKPQLWGYVVLPIENGFAFDWWGSALVMMLGVYAFLLVLIRNWKWASLGALAFYANPFFHWWYLPTTLSPVGFTAGGLALLLLAARSSGNLKRQLVLSAGAGYLFTCNAFLLYPPFQIPIALVFGSASIGLLAHWLLKKKLSIWSVVFATSIALAVPLIVYGSFVLTHSEAFTALSQTVYPGGRRAEGGSLEWQYLASGWFSWVIYRQPEELRAFIGNESEFSSFLMTGLFLLPALPLIWPAIADLGRRARLPLIGIMAATALISIHMFVGLPAVIARLTALDRVPPARAVVGLGMASVLLMVVVGESLARAHLRQWRRVVGSLIVSVFSAGYIVSMGDRLQDAGAPVGTRSILISASAAALVAICFFWRPLIATAGLVLFGLALSAPVNPLANGLEVLQSDRVVAQLRTASESNPEGLWVTEFVDLSTVLTANGFNDVSSINFYPNFSGWETLDPSGRYEEIWNRYSHTNWTFDLAAGSPVISLIGQDTIGIRLDPCGSEASALGISYFVAGRLLAAPCLELATKVTTPQEWDGYVYRRTIDAEN